MDITGILAEVGPSGVSRVPVCMGGDGRLERHRGLRTTQAWDSWTQLGLEMLREPQF